MHFFFAISTRPTALLHNCGMSYEDNKLGGVKPSTVTRRTNRLQSANANTDFCSDLSPLSVTLVLSMATNVLFPLATSALVNFSQSESLDFHLSHLTVFGVFFWRDVGGFVYVLHTLSLSTTKRVQNIYSTKLLQFL